jgi:FAD/FMN-containing dehydrogenase
MVKRTPAVSDKSAATFSQGAAPTTIQRRTFLKTAALLAVSPASAKAAFQRPAPAIVVNDIHAQLNATRVRRIVEIDSLKTLQASLRRAAEDGDPVCIAGGRHAMGGQQFRADATMLDIRRLNKVLRFDADKGLVEVESGIMWPTLMDDLLTRQAGRQEQWGIAQKQTGADRLTIGGALSANIHGRGLTMKPIISDVESFVLIDASGRARTCSRRENAELFGLAIGGYGLFGTIATVTLRLVPRRKIQRIVEVRTIDHLPEAFERRIVEGFSYGDFQFAIDETSDDFLRRGVFSCYKPVDASTPVTHGQKELVDDDWRHLLLAAHASKAEAFEQYAKYYLATNGQVYWSDTHQLSTYLDDYHKGIDAQTRSSDPATEMITEIYVPRPRLPDFMSDVAQTFRTNGVPIIYGTVRLIEKDDESFLAWATEPYACIIFNLHVVHTPAGIEKAAQAFRSLIDLAIKRRGRYYLTYHRHATRQQVDACYPQLAEFLRLKMKYDPHERFQSEWYRHYKTMFATG